MLLFRVMLAPPKAATVHLKEQGEPNDLLSHFVARLRLPFDCLNSILLYILFKLYLVSTLMLRDVYFRMILLQFIESFLFGLNWKISDCI